MYPSKDQYNILYMSYVYITYFDSLFKDFIKFFIKVFEGL